MTAFHALVLAIVQGITELFPISSLGHAVILPPLLHWPVDEHGRAFLPFLVVLHVGTAAALLLYFWRDWLYVARGVLGRRAFGREAPQEARRLLGLIIVATLPAVVIGFALEKFVRDLFASPVVAALFLIVNGCLLFAGDRMRRRGSGVNFRGQHLEALDWWSAFLIGLWQCTAFIPGISRSGATMVGGVLTGLDHSDAARFSFLIATPIIAGAAVLEVPKLLHSPGAGITGVAVGAGLAAGITAYASIAFLMRYFRRHDFDDALVPFAIYCWVAGAAATVVLLLGG